MKEKIIEADTLLPGVQKRYVAGPYDRKKQLPRYRPIIDVPAHVKHQVKRRDFLVGSEEEYYTKMFEIDNQSSYPAKIRIVEIVET